ncbi:TRAP transporter large permease (plasmid) [Haloferax prahovense]|jgi:tripartite ATP-independent transporter DctM subunit|uniref:TRAP transporter large permease n=1 Tax=Haloferax prahovense TaxID=381852 RepID=UPI003C741618
MQAEHWGVLVIVAFFILLALRVHVAVALAAPSIMYLLINGEPLSIVGQNMVYSLFSYTILSVPLFIFVGTFLNETGATTRIFDFTRYFMGEITGGLAYVNIYGSLIFSGISGAALADIGGIGRMMLFAMDEDGYDRGYSAALTSASAIVGPIFPPSIPLIVYALIAEQPVIPLFLAGIGPALLLVALLTLATMVLGRGGRFPTATKTSVSFKQLLYAIPAVITPVILVAGMLTGYFGPTGIAGAAIMYTLFLAVVVYRDMETDYLFNAARDTAATTSTILFTVGAAVVFAYVMTITRIPTFVSEFMFSITTNPALVLLTMLVTILLVGLVIEAMSAMLMLTPIFLPIASDIGVGPIHFGVILVYGLMFGLVTPPFGLALFMMSDVSNVEVEKIVKEMVPYYVPLLVGFILIAYFPPISVWVLDFL